ncbi:MAG TPA: undecaprenyl-phosphate galactose phosphotransferase WbaP [Bryobacteraceae bacterium]|jgi:Undecaprenyl-phosphate galactose phosphotransferase WbaP
MVKRLDHIPGGELSALIALDGRTVLRERWQAPAAVQCQPRLAGALIAAADLTSLVLSAVVCVVLRWMAGGDYPLTLYWRLWPVLALFPAVYALFGLYPGIVNNAVTEIRRITAATTSVFLMLAVLTFLIRLEETYSRLVFFASWLAALLLAPIGRVAARRLFARKDWWGYPAVVFGGGETGRMIVRSLQIRRELGFRIQAVIDPRLSQKELYGIPVYRHWEDASLVRLESDVSHAIIAMPEMPSAKLLSLIESHAGSFPKVLIIPDFGGLSSIGIEAQDFCRQLALEVRRSLLQPGAQIAKRLLDMTLGVLVCLLALPFVLLIYLLLKVESRGPAFYSQTRLGRGGRTFRIWKFRSMVPNADRILNDYLAAHPELRLEWEKDHKLRKDPRITRLGRVLRTTSLDELPQLWNVIRGDMSLVGPRPIVDAEIFKYGAAYQLYKQVLPGITGLWQVSGRNNTTYPERIALDSYYVRNWSPWFDLYILGRTIKVVIAHEGAC